MKAAILCEFASIRTILVQMVVIYLIVGVVVGVSIQSSIALVACIAAMTPFLAVFSLAAYDDANGWERYRACLPISRGAIVAGRYAAVLAITAFMALLAIAVALALANAAPYLPISRKRRRRSPPKAIRCRWLPRQLRAHASFLPPPR